MHRKMWGTTESFVSISFMNKSPRKIFAWNPDKTIFFFIILSFGGIIGLSFLICLTHHRVISYLICPKNSCKARTYLRITENILYTSDSSTLSHREPPITKHNISCGQTLNDMAVKGGMLPKGYGLNTTVLPNSYRHLNPEVTSWWHSRGSNLHQLWCLWAGSHESSLDPLKGSSHKVWVKSSCSPIPGSPCAPPSAHISPMPFTPATVWLLIWVFPKGPCIKGLVPRVVCWWLTNKE